MKPLTWAIIGPGAIAHQFAAAMEALGRKVYAVGARNRERGESFAQRYGIERVDDNSERLLADPHIDAVYISTPHASHFTWMKLALEHGKHLLVEKAITVSSMELDEIDRLAAEKKLIVAEAMTLFHMPLFHQLKETLESGRLGKVKTIQVSFGTVKEPDPENRFFNPALAGGSISAPTRCRSRVTSCRRSRTICSLPLRHSVPAWMSTAAFSCKTRSRNWSLSRWRFAPKCRSAALSPVKRALSP